MASPTRTIPTILQRAGQGGGGQRRQQSGKAQSRQGPASRRNVHQRLARHPACRGRSHLNIVSTPCLHSAKYGKPENGPGRGRDLLRFTAFVWVSPFGSRRAQTEPEFSALVRCLLLWLSPAPGNGGWGFFCAGPLAFFPRGILESLL